MRFIVVLFLVCLLLLICHKREGYSDSDYGKECKDVPLNLSKIAKEG